jgi:endo-1,4-beta-xylanase
LIPSVVHHRTLLALLAFGPLAAALGGCTDSSYVPATPREAAETRERLFGTALNTAYLKEQVYTQLAGTEFDYVTPEWEMKWDPTEPAPGQFNFALGDAVVEFAASHGQQVKGHTLVWHYALPAWVSALTSADELRAAMVNHITTVVGHYAGQIKAWDVVNEALSDSTPTTLNDTIFFKLLGPTYIDEAFRAARAADPGALLFYNESNIEISSDKLEATYNLVARLKADGVPIDGVGFEMHVDASHAPTGAQMTAALKRFTDLGLMVNFSELDVRLGSLVDDDQETKLYKQERRYHDLVAACVQNPLCVSITTWGVTDQFSWLDRDQSMWSWAGQGPHTPLLFNADGSRKPAYAGVFQALLGQ